MKSRPPNVVLVITDDQGYGDLGCTGNPWIQTPCIDAFSRDAVRFTDFHVQPLCTPTRGTIMSGRRPLRNGAWATCWGRSILRRDEITLADVFRAGGYRTGLFGKWHLGDNYPYRPQDRGFDHVVAHKGGGVGQTPDFWGNNYFDDVYFHNSLPVAHSGYCTDVWFDEAARFIESAGGKPFFAMISTNAPHDPFLVPDRYARPYEGNPQIPHPRFYGMITCIDENFGRLRALLARLGIERDTILIFMTDNGSVGSAVRGEGEFTRLGYNAQMRGLKGSYYDGGHRVPCMVRWPGGGVAGGREVDEMSLGMDLLPTLAELCGLSHPRPERLEGMSLASLLTGRRRELEGDRVEFLQYRQGTDVPDMWTNCVMTRRWRLVRGRELYDIKADPGQKRDVAAEHPDVLRCLRGEHERWWADVSVGLDRFCPIALGGEPENPTRLCSMDVMGDVVWNQAQVAMAMKSSGRWCVSVERAGRYRIELRRWPEELDMPISEVLDEARAAMLAPCHRPFGGCHAVPAAGARVSICGRSASAALAAGAKEATFEIELEQTAQAQLEACFTLADGQEQGAYYVSVEMVESPSGE
jgi:arylsulfatase A-like enzyme